MNVIRKNTTTKNSLIVGPRREDLILSSATPDSLALRYQTAFEQIVPILRRCFPGSTCRGNFNMRGQINVYRHVGSDQRKLALAVFEFNEIGHVYHHVVMKDRLRTFTRERSLSDNTTREAT